MATATATSPIDKERVRNTYELPSWAKVWVTYVRTRVWKAPEHWEWYATFKHMDWMYGLWVDENWDNLIFNWKFKQKDEVVFELIDDRD